jgi:GNAT superfamily N-acetyltransferase
MPEIITTYLQMRAPEQLSPARASDPDFIVREAVERDWRTNRSMYLLVGEQWAWIDKLRWSDQEWKRYAADEQRRTFVASWRGTTAGYYELRRDDTQAVEVAYFGLTPDFIGRGLGGALLTDALTRAWAWDAQRVWLQTCTLDHPAALKNYLARGMQVYERKTRQVE